MDRSESIQKFESYFHQCQTYKLLSVIRLCNVKKREAKDYDKNILPRFTVSESQIVVEIQCTDMSVIFTLVKNKRIREIDEE